MENRRYQVYGRILGTNLSDVENLIVNDADKDLFDGRQFVTSILAESEEAARSEIEKLYVGSKTYNAVEVPV
jgi:hypothetical protein